MARKRDDVTRKALKRLRKRREQLGLSQADVAESAGVNASYIGLLERCERVPSIDVLVRFAAAVGLPLPEVFATATPPEGKEQPEMAQLRSLTASWPVDQRKALVRVAREIDKVRVK